ncbi:MAG: amidohydrolase family protein [Melioribacteraceae bacterium]
MKYNLVKKWLISLTITLVVTTIIGIVYANYELKYMYGGCTKVVDTTPFYTKAKPTAITNLSILSSDGNHFVENKTVLIDNGEIILIGAVDKIPKDNLVINGEGKYLIPGLINSHVHLWQSPNDLLLYLANGITHIREMMGSSEHLKWRKEIEEDKRLGPKMFVASNKVQSFGMFEGWLMNWIQGNINLNKPDKVISTLKSISNDGYDAVKLGSFLSKDIYESISINTSEIEIPLLGHLPLSSTLNKLWNSKQRELSHIEEIVKALRKEFGKVNVENKKEFLQFVRKRSHKVADNFLRKDIAVATTLWLTESIVKQKFELQELLKEIKLSYANPGIIEGTILTSRGLGWLPEINLYRLPKDISAKKFKKENNYWTAYVEASRILINVMAQKGVKILAGTDSNLPVVVPGFSLHNELISLTKAGMTTSQALHSATSVPASWMKIKSGKISLNHRADLVLLNKNPLENIENTKAIESVILNGKIFTRKQLDAILDAVKEANDESRNIDISSFVN